MKPGLLAVAAVSSLTLLLFYASLVYFRAAEFDELRGQLSLYSRSLASTLEQFETLPYVLSRDLMVTAATSETSNDELSRRFASVADKAGLEAIYLMNSDGLVIASSNYDAELTFLGQNYGFRPYFQNALAGRRAEYFGVGATTSRAGYFIAEQVRDGAGQVLGVIAIKLDMTELQKSWETGTERVFVTNKDGVIVLSFNRDWLYRTLSAIPGEQLETIRATRQFGRHALRVLDDVTTHADRMNVAGEDFLHLSEPASRLGWRIHYLSTESRVYERSVLTVVVVGILLSIMLLVAMALRSARITATLKASQADRRQLQAANAKLEQAQAELARTSKLAALGQLSASVTHELGQPISALRNHLAAVEIAGDLDNRDTLKRLITIVDRMESITRQLRFFAQPRKEEMTKITLQKVVEGALELVEHDLDHAGMTLRLVSPDAPIVVEGTQVRLEQAVVNLVKNAIAAMEDTSATDMKITIRSYDTRAIIEVTDAGPGFGSMSFEEMSEPFRTSRASGDGMGLGLSIVTSIVAEHGGELSATSKAGEGSTVTISLPASD